jgi:hypothetical protein
MCKFGEKCKFRNLSVNKINDILNKYQELKQEKASLKLQLKGKCFKLKNLGEKYCDVTNDNVYTLLKPSYNSLK